MPSLRPLAAAALAALAVLLAAVPAPAATVPVRVGIGDQSASIFDQREFADLDIKRVRYRIAWDAIDDPYLLQQADGYVDAATRGGATVFMVPTVPAAGDGPVQAPSPGAYRRKVGALVQRYRRVGVREWGVLDGVNRGVAPARAARLFRTMHRVCRGCTVVALDVLEGDGARGYVARFFAALPPAWDRRARIVGIHNYSDVNHRRLHGTRRVVAAVRAPGRNPDARFWVTETGGLVAFGDGFPCDERRAADRIRFMFASMRRQAADIERLYAYAYWGNDCREGFDAGLVDAAGTPRPGYRAFKRAAASFLR